MVYLAFLADSITVIWEARAILVSAWALNQGMGIDQSCLSLWRVLAQRSDFKHKRECSIQARITWAHGTEHSGCSISPRSNMSWWLWSKAFILQRKKTTPKSQICTICYWLATQQSKATLIIIPTIVIPTSATAWMVLTGSTSEDVCYLESKITECWGESGSCREVM